MKKGVAHLRNGQFPKWEIKKVAAAKAPWPLYGIYCEIGSAIYSFKIFLVMLPLSFRFAIVCAIEVNIIYF
ncbi:MAG TPA: hypothetical protein VFM72_06185 [Aequorivita sp.]|nr:hypothetical protein [Aequorivita sp.]